MLLHHYGGPGQSDIDLHRLEGVGNSVKHKQAMAEIALPECASYVIILAKDLDNITTRYA